MIRWRLQSLQRCMCSFEFGIFLYRFRCHVSVVGQFMIVHKSGIGKLALAERSKECRLVSLSYFTIFSDKWTRCFDSVCAHIRSCAQLEMSRCQTMCAPNRNWHTFSINVLHDSRARSHRLLGTQATRPHHEIRFETNDKQIIRDEKPFRKRLKRFAIRLSLARSHVRMAEISGAWTLRFAQVWQMAKRNVDTNVERHTHTPGSRSAQCVPFNGFYWISIRFSFEYM